MRINRSKIVRVVFITLLITLSCTNIRPWI
jgi:hypothetical protein